MEFIVKSAYPEKHRSECLIAGVFESRKLSPTAHRLDEATKGAIRTLVNKGDIEGKLGQTTLLHHMPNLLAERLFLIGCGEEKKCSESLFREILIKISATLKETGAQEATFFIEDIPANNRDLLWKIRQAVQIFYGCQYSFENFKSIKKNNKKPFRRFTFIVSSKREIALAEKTISEALAIAHGVEVTKNLANVPANICTPTYIAHEAKKLAKKHSKLSVAVLEENDMKALKMGALLSVTAGSDTPAKLITLEYRGAKKATKPIVLIGKGITFDTGGNSIKVPPNMIGMKYDMCGAATVFGVLTAAMELALPLNIIGIIPSCENRVGSRATMPEDIVTTMSGLTVEILNTDAEGRLILCDALTYSERFNPECVIDIATLTAACKVALGTHASALMSNHDPLANALLKAGNDTYDRAWPLPLWEEYHTAIKSEFADISNVPLWDVGGRSIIAGCFLAKFAQKFNWAHLDVANTATGEGLSRAATGRPVPLLVQFLLGKV